MTCFLLEEAPKLPESESIIYLNYSSEFGKQITTCFVAWTLPTKDDLGMRPTRCCKAGFSEVHLEMIMEIVSEDGIITNDRSLRRYPVLILIFWYSFKIDEFYFLKFRYGLKVSESLNLSLWIDDLEPWDYIKQPNQKSKYAWRVWVCVFIFFSITNRIGWRPFHPAFVKRNGSTWLEGLGERHVCPDGQCFGLHPFFWDPSSRLGVALGWNYDHLEGLEPGELMTTTISLSLNSNFVDGWLKF